MVGIAWPPGLLHSGHGLYLDWSISIPHWLLNILNSIQDRVTDLQGGQEGMITTHMLIGPPFRPPPFSGNKACLKQVPPPSPTQFEFFSRGTS